MPKTVFNSLMAVFYKILIISGLILSVQSSYAQTLDAKKLQQFEEAILRGEDFLKVQNYAQAKAEYQKALSIDPSAKYPQDKLAQIRKFYIDPEDESRFTAAMENGNRLFQAKNYEAARAQFSVASNIKPEDKTAREKMNEAGKLAEAQKQTQDQYNNAIKQADNLFTTGNMPLARDAYTQASSIKPNEAYPQQKISEIDAKIATEQARKDSYEKILAEGDEAYMNRDFALAKIKYEQSLKVKPGESYPKSMLERVSSGIAEMIDAQQNYQSTIASADQLFQAKDYEAALMAYQGAARILPSEKYPAEQIEKINVVLKQKQKIEEDYQLAVTTGDQLLAAQKLMDARTEFQKANDLKPAETYPKQKIQEIAFQLLALKDAEREKQYNDAIGMGDKNLSELKYQEAISAYTEAKTIKPEEDYPSAKIQEINKTLESQKAAQNAYENTILEADTQFAAGKLDEAKSTYTKAQTLKPGDPYPASQIAKANELLAEKARIEKDYNDAVAEADKLLNEDKLSEAITGYTLASNLKPESSYPKEQIAAIKARLDELKSKEEQYAALIAKGDLFFDKDELESASSAYNQANNLKPGEKYPGERIEKISKTLEERRKKREYYAQIVEHADGLFDGGEYEQALPAYTEANSLFPKEVHPIERIESIKKILDERKALEENYARYIKEGDQNFEQKIYQKALNAYQQAKALKPKETYPPSQIALIERALEAEKALLSSYEQTIAAADGLMSASNLVEARQEYTKALALKQDETYPREQIQKIDTKLAQAEQMEKDYKAAIDEADKYFKEKKLTDALGKYTIASNLKTESQYPKDQIALIEASLAELQSKDEQYAAHIAEGDRLFNNSELETAAIAYNKALEVKPGEKYPGERIANITKTLEEQRQKLTDFTSLIERADQLFDAAKYEQALPAYKEANGLFPAEAHPLERIERINKIIEDRKALEENFARYIKEGDEDFEQKKYQAALSAYRQAKTLKPEDVYPKTQIARIEKALEAEKALLDNYQQAIAVADGMFNAGNLNEASTKYAEAKRIKPEEVYPGEQIERINSILKQQKEIDKNYAQSIEDGNRLFAAKDYEAARTKYTEAASLKPNEPYPAKKIAEIQTLLGALEQIEEQYNTAISLADEKLNVALLDEAETAYQQAKRIKPQETYPTKQLEVIQQKREKEKTMAFNYENAVSKGDAMYKEKDYPSSLASYQQALEYKPGAEHPSNRIEEITGILQEQKQLADKGYNEAIDNADRLFTEKDYTSALKFYENASTLKPLEKYPKDKILAIRAILQERSRNQMEAYNKIILNADRLYQDKVLDQAIDAYMEAAVAKPDETYPMDMIAKIRKYLEEHAMVDLVNSPESIEIDSEKRFNFTPIDMRLRKNNYISINARKTSETDPKVYVNYGKGNQKNGGIVLRSITSDENGDFLVRVSIQDRWYREDNNWISIYAEGGSIEISKMKIAQGD